MKIPIGGGEPVQLAAGSAAVWYPMVTDSRCDRSVSAQRVWVGDADGLEPQEVKDAASPDSMVTWLSDGRLAWQTSDARNYRIRDLANGREELLVKNPEVGCVFQPHFSPRGYQVAVIWNRAEGTKDLSGDCGFCPGPPARHGSSRRISGPSDGRRTATGCYFVRGLDEGRSSESLLARPR